MRKDKLGKEIHSLLKLAWLKLWASQVAFMIKNPPANAEDVTDLSSVPGWGRSPGEGHGNLFQHFFPVESYGQRSLVGYSTYGRTESDTTEVTLACMHG